MLTCGFVALILNGAFFSVHSEAEPHDIIENWLFRASSWGSAVAAIAVAHALGGV
jgi:hypothetical protein